MRNKPRPKGRADEAVAFVARHSGRSRARDMVEFMTCLASSTGMKARLASRRSATLQTGLDGQAVGLEGLAPTPLFERVPAARARYRVADGCRRHADGYIYIPST